jgi:hypothetical protein
MADEAALTAAEREYQARLVALHDARAALAAESARLRRLHLDRRLATGMSETAVAELGHKIESLTALVAGLRDRAEAQRQVLRQLTDTDFEPLEVAEDEHEAGHFEQPPFTEPK